MGKKLNNKGLTAVEILVCFSIVSIVVVSMFKVVNNQRDKQTIASYKNSVTTYKNSVMKTIEDGIIKGEGIESATFLESEENPMQKLVVDIILKKQSQTPSPYMGSNINMNYKIKIEVYKKKDYSDTDETSSDYIVYKYYDWNTFDDILHDTASETEKFPIPKVPNLRFNLIKYSREDEEYFKLYVGLTQPDLGNRYSVIDIVEPINR